jgi:endonuclease/exonuclease/phosphatase (EEP) superfamily protein YafD
MSRRRRAAAVMDWGPLLAAVGVLASPWAHLVHRRLPTLHVISRSLVPWAGLLAVPSGLRAARTRNARLGVASLGVALAGAAAAGWVRGRLQTRRATGPAVSVAHFNLLYLNQRLDDGAARIAALDADVVTFSELTPRHLETLRRSPLADRYPHRIDDPGPYARGTALWSRFPVTRVDGPELEHHTVAADVDAGPAGALRVLVIHTRSPMHHVAAWAADLLELAAEPAPADRAAVLIGDFNAAWGHPEYRRLAAAGWRDAHRELGRGLTNSWPTDHWSSPAFVRLDHALLNDATGLADVIDVDLPGSDHRGLIVSVIPNHRPAH